MTTIWRGQLDRVSAAVAVFSKVREEGRSVRSEILI
jgi:hypothetical protein